MNAWRAGERVSVRGRRWRIAGVTRAPDCAALRLTELGTTRSDRSLTILTPFDRPEPLERRALPRVMRPRRWLHELDRALVAVRPFGSLIAIAETPIRLRPYQLEPALAMCRHGATRVLVADGVGLGKTIQAGVVLRELSARADGTRALVLVPAGLREQWINELATHFTLATTRADAAWLRATTRERPPGVNPWSLPGIYVASDDFVKRPEALRPLDEVTWDVVIVDEAHRASSGTDRRAAVDAIARRSRRVMLLTATPPVGDPAELAALCRIGRVSEGDEPPLLFMRTKADVDAGRPRKTVVLTVTPSAAERQMHRLLDRYSREVWQEGRHRHDTRATLASIVLRKRALSSAGSLCASVERRLDLLAGIEDPQEAQLRLPLGRLDDEDPLEDDAPSAVLAAPGLSDPRRERRWLVAIAEVARTAARAETKLHHLLRLLARVREPVLVFTEYRDTLARVQRHIAATGRSLVVLHGGMTSGERSRIPQAFAEGADTLLATDAASEGLNLHHRCRIVIHYELPWNPARLEQRAGRVDRLGQARRVHEIALVAADTAERLVLAPLAARAARGGLAGAGVTGRLIDTLTESRIAEAVLANDVAPVVDAAPAMPLIEATAADFRDEAASEADRLERERLLIARSCRGRPPANGGGPVVSVLRSAARLGTSARGLVLFYVIAVEDEDGRRLDSAPFVVQLTLGGTSDLASTYAHLRTTVAPFVDPTHPGLSLLLRTATRSAVRKITAMEQQARAPRVAREAAIAGAKRSAARALVQCGLFERYVTPALVAHDDAPDDPLSTGAPSTLRGLTTLVAALVVDHIGRGA